MVSAWYMDDSDADQRLEHKPTSTRYVDLKELRKLTGVEYWEIDADAWETSTTLNKIRIDRDYSFQDEITITENSLPNYHKMLKIFFTEHLHADEEIRFILDGSGYLDVRDYEDKWIRIKIEKNDMLVLPAGIYHRFTLDDKNYLKAKRYFCGEPVWTAHFRPSDEHPARVKYLAERKSACCDTLCNHMT